MSAPNFNKCIFCKIISKEAPAQILYEDETIIVFEDIKPVSKFHFLVCPKEHIGNVNILGPEDKELVNKLLECGQRILEEKGGDPSDVRLGFHLPPFNSVSHLHLHVISPTSEMSYFQQIVFKPNTWWFASVEQILEKLGNSKL